MIDAVYFAIASCAAAIGGVIGFALQVRNLEKSRLEIEELKRRAADAEAQSQKLRLELSELAHRVELTRLNRDKTELEVDRLKREQPSPSGIVTGLSNEDVLRFGRPSHAPARTTQVESRRVSHLILALSAVAAAVAAAVTIVLSWEELRLGLEVIRQWLQQVLGAGR